jgi:uncharacterized membrane protein
MRMRLRNLDAHQRLLIAAVVALVTFLLASGHLRPSLQSIFVWNAFAWCFVVSSWARIAFADARTSVQFLFNTVILALTINLASGLVS